MSDTWLLKTIIPGNRNVDSKCPTHWLSVTIMWGNQNVNSKCLSLQILITTEYQYNWTEQLNIWLLAYQMSVLRFVPGYQNVSSKYPAL